MAIATYFNFGVHFDYTEYIHKHKTTSQGAITRLRGYILTSWSTVNNSEMAKGGDFKFGVCIDLRNSFDRMQKLGQKGRGPFSAT